MNGTLPSEFSIFINTVLSNICLYYVHVAILAARVYVNSRSYKKSTTRYHFAISVELCTVESPKRLKKFNCWFRLYRYFRGALQDRHRRRARAMYTIVYFAPRQPRTNRSKGLGAYSFKLIPSPKTFLCIYLICVHF